MVANSFHYPEVLWGGAEAKIISVVFPGRIEKAMSADVPLSDVARMGKSATEMPDIIRVERRRLDFKTLVTRHVQEFNDDLSKLGREALGFLRLYGTAAPLLSRSEHGRAVKAFCATFASDLRCLGRQTCDFLLHYAALGSLSSGLVLQRPKENCYTVCQKFVCEFICELGELLLQSVRFAWHYSSLRFTRTRDEKPDERKGGARNENVTFATPVEGSSRCSTSSDSQSASAFSRYPSQFTSSAISMKTSSEEISLSQISSQSPTNDSVDASQPSHFKEPGRPSYNMSLTRGTIGLLPRLAVVTTNYVAGFCKDVLNLQKCGVDFLVSLLPTLQQLKTSAFFHVMFAKEMWALIVYVFKFIVYYLLYPYPVRLLKCFKSFGVPSMVFDALKFSLKAVLGIFTLGRTIFSILFIAREDEVVDSNEQNEKAKSEHEIDLPEIKVNPEDLKGIELKPAKPAIKKLQQLRNAASNSEPKHAKRVKIPSPSKKSSEPGDDEFEYERPEMAKESRNLPAGKSRSECESGNRRKRDYSTEEDDSAYNSVKAVGVRRKAAKQKSADSSDEEIHDRRKAYYNRKETRDGACQTGMGAGVQASQLSQTSQMSQTSSKAQEKSFTDAGTDPVAHYGTDTELAGRRNKSRHSSGAAATTAGFYSSDDMSECSDLMPDHEQVGN